MRYKAVPEPREVDFLRSVRDALPLVPDSVENCCSRIRDRTDVASRDDAREWLTFLQALGMAAETERGYYRVREEVDRSDLASAYEQGVFGAEEVLATLESADEPLTVDETFEQIRNIVPKWERNHHADWESEWRERVAWLLEWGVVFGRVTERVDGYELAE